MGSIRPFSGIRLLVFLERAANLADVLDVRTEEGGNQASLLSLSLLSTPFLLDVGFCAQPSSLEL